MVTTSTEQLLEVNGVELCAQTFGDPSHAAILLMSGSGASMDWWPEQLCSRVAACGRFVVRYDFRDTGRSVSYPVGAPGYSGRDLVDDAVGLLDVLDIASAHVVGISMGGGLAQVLAGDHPDRVASLTLVSTSSVAPRDPGLPPLPGPTAELRATFEHPPPEPDWDDADAVIEYLVETERPYRGSVCTGDEETRAIAARVIARSRDIRASVTNHSLLASGAAGAPNLGEIRAPTLVVHGTEDPLFPFEHASALVDVIPGASLLALEGVGHQVPPSAVWDLVVPALVAHTAELG
jgi:pimeloyl-ACP methyl ester carboxylesterase